MHQANISPAERRRRESRNLQRPDLTKLMMDQIHPHEKPEIIKPPPRIPIGRRGKHLRLPYASVILT